MSYNREYPYNDSGRMDVDWLLNQLKSLESQLTEGLSYKLTLDGKKLYLKGSDGSVSIVTLPESGGSGVTYTLTYANSVLTLVGSDGSTSSVTITGGGGGITKTVLSYDGADITDSEGTVLTFSAIRTLLQDGGTTVVLDYNGNLLLPAYTYAAATYLTFEGITQDEDYDQVTRITVHSTNAVVEENNPIQPYGHPLAGTLTFTGAAEAEFDGTEDVTVNVPEGGGSSPSAMTLIAEIDMSESGAASSVEFTGLAELTEICFIWSNVCNGSTGSDINLKINDTSIAQPIVPISASTTQDGYSTARWNGYGWESRVSAGAISASNLTLNNSNARAPYNLLEVGKCTTLTLLNPVVSTYRANIGTIKIYGR